ncbi:hypothetical protein F5Y14DRAFT_435976 [Nemania sp. NC0429]|nr:hypothetical protein F5Y14DRAFT_435976 [Nemania sp. NC0429]
MTLVFRPLLLFSKPLQLHGGHGSTLHRVLLLLCIMRRVSYDGPVTTPASNPNSISFLLPLATDLVDGGWRGHLSSGHSRRR